MMCIIVDINQIIRLKLNIESSAHPLKEFNPPESLELEDLFYLTKQCKQGHSGHYVTLGFEVNFVWFIDLEFTINCITPSIYLMCEAL